MANRRHNEVQPSVFVVDNDQVLRESLAWLIESAGFPVRSYESGEAFLDACTNEVAGCAILDVRLPGISGVALQDELRRRGLRLPVIIITGFADVQMAIRVLKAGALDLIEKPFAEETILERVRQAMLIDAEERRQRAELDRTAALLSRLTARERAVFNMVVHGKANKVVAYDLGISPKTVETHRARVMQKLEARSLADLVRVGLIAERHVGGGVHPASWIPAAGQSVAA
jgi:FixJ family two-component response regulator